MAVMAPPALASNTRGEVVAGQWGGAVPCVPTSADPTTGETTCLGSTTWIGGLTGQTHYVFTGTLDLTTGAGSGKIDETFIGRDADGRTGTLRFTETIASKPTGLPATGSVVIDAKVVEATGDFAGTRGELVFEGTVNAVAGDLGTYSGTLKIKDHG
jgi:hypothetical protein